MNLATCPDRPLAPADVQARWREAFAYANRSNQIEGLPPPSELGLQVQQRIIEGRMTVEEGITMLVRHYITGEATEAVVRP